MMNGTRRVRLSLRRVWNWVRSDRRKWKPRDWTLSLGSLPLVLVLVVGDGSLFAQPQRAQRADNAPAEASATLTGKVVDGLGRGLRDVRVTARTPDLPVPIPVSTDDQGNFNFRSGLPAGDYEFTFILPPRNAYPPEQIDCGSGLGALRTQSLPGRRVVRSVNLSPGELAEIIVVIEDPQPPFTVDCVKRSDVWWPRVEQ